MNTNDKQQPFEAREKAIDTCTHERFNDGYQQRCEGCGYPRQYILGYTAAAPQWKAVSEDNLPDDANITYWISCENDQGEKLTDAAYYEPNQEIWYWAHDTDRDGDRIAVHLKVEAFMPYEKPQPYQAPDLLPDAGNMEDQDA